MAKEKENTPESGTTKQEKTATAATKKATVLSSFRDKDNFDTQYEVGDTVEFSKDRIAGLVHLGLVDDGSAAETEAAAVKAAEEAKKAADEAAKKATADAKKAEDDAKKKAADEAKKAQDEAKKKADDEAKQAAEEAAKAKAEADAQSQQ